MPKLPARQLPRRLPQRRSQPLHQLLPPSQSQHRHPPQLLPSPKQHQHPLPLSQHRPLHPLQLSLRSQWLLPPRLHRQQRERAPRALLRLLHRQLLLQQPLSLLQLLPAHLRRALGQWQAPSSTR